MLSAPRASPSGPAPCHQLAQKSYIPGWRRKLAPLLGSLLAAGAVLLLHRALLTAQRVHTQLQSYRVNRNLSAYSDLM